MKNHISSLRTLSSLVALSGFLASGAAGAADNNDGYVPGVHAGRASVYEQLPEQSLEQVTPSERILAVAKGGAEGKVAPTEIWRALEHAERVECLGCIPAVSKLLFSGNRKTREISAWWLRRRIFGVFGAGQVYPELLGTAQNDGSESRRAYAVEALGEFLHKSGVPVVARAAVQDSSAMVRLSAVRALDRLNTQGPNGELAQAISDPSVDVRLAALEAAVHVHVFTRVDAVVSRLGDGDAAVRRRAAEALGNMRARDAVASLIAVTDPEREKDARVRAAAVSALGRIADPEAKEAVQAAEADPSSMVRDMAKIALRRL